MKKLLTILLGLFMVLSLAGCGAKEEQQQDEPVVDPAPTAANTYADFLASDGSEELEILMSVQAHESWWDGKVTVYGQDDDGAYLCYDMACDEATANAMTPGTLIRVKGYKAEWSGELELADATCEIIAGGYDGKVYDPVDLTSLIGNDDELAKHMNKKSSFKNLTVVDYTYNWDGSGTRDDSDIYLNVTDENGTAITFTVRRYLTDNTTDVYKAVEALQAGDVVDLVAFLYWYEAPQARIIEVVKH